MKSFLLYIVMLSMLNLSCTYLKQAHGRVRVEEGKQLDDAITKKRIRMLVLKREYTKALELIKNAVASGRPQRSYGKECVTSINGLADEGIRALSQGKYGSAGVKFRTIIDNYPVDKDLQAGINHPLAETRSYLETCSEKLMEQGLLAYRRGDLEKAISIWEKILKFNPEYMDVRKMIETATVQVENLETIK